MPHGDMYPTALMYHDCLAVDTRMTSERSWWASSEVEPRKVGRVRMTPA